MNQNDPESFSVASDDDAAQNADDPFIVVERFSPKLSVHRWRRADTHTFHEWLLVNRGHYRAATAAGPISCGVNGVLSFPAGCQHLPQLPRDGSVELFLLRASARLWSPPVATPRCVTDHRGRLRTLLHWMYDLSLLVAAAPHHQQRLWQQRLRHLLLVFIDEFAAAASQAPDVASLGAQACLIMQQQLATGTTITGLCQQLGVSRATLYRAVRQHCGASPQGYLHDLRQATAQQLADHAGANLSTIAAAIGVTSTRTVRRLLQRSKT